MGMNNDSTVQPSLARHVHRCSADGMCLPPPPPPCNHPLTTSSKLSPPDHPLTGSAMAFPVSPPYLSGWPLGKAEERSLCCCQRMGGCV